MQTRVFGLDSTQALIAAQSCAAIVVGYGLALRFDWEASSVATTIIVLQTAALGSTLNKAALRMVGTLAGAVAGLALVALFSHDQVLFILGMALLTGICVWAMQKSSHTYAWMLVLLTSAIVGWPAATNPLNSFQTSIDRVTAVTVGVILSGLAQGVFWPVTARGKFERSMRDLVTGCRQILQFVREGLLQQEMDGEAIIELESKVLSLSTTLDTTLEAARAESKQLSKYFLRYQQLSDELVNLFLATTAISDASRQCAGDSRAVILDSVNLRDMFDSIDNACVATIEQLSLPRDGTSRPTDSDNATNNSVVRNSQLAHNSELEGSIATSLLRDRLRAFGVVSTCVRRALVEVEDPHKTIQLEKAVPVPGLSPSVRMRKSALATLQVLLAASFFVTLDWPLGLQSSMMLVMIFAFMNAQLPVALLTRTILKSTLSALLLASVFYFILMPRVDSYIDLAPWLALLFFPLMYGVASQNPSKSLAAKLSVILVNSLISISTTPPSYDFASFANMSIGMSGGLGVVLFLAYLFETRSPRRGFHKLLAAMLSEAAANLTALDEHPRPTPEWNDFAKTRRKQLLNSLGKMKKLSAMVDFRQDPGVSQDDLQAVMRTFDVLMMKLIGSFSPDSSFAPEADRQNGAIKRMRDWCIESLTATEAALASCQPVSMAPPSERLFDEADAAALRDWQSSRTSHLSMDADRASATETQHFREITIAISDCQRELNRVNWKRWSQSYF